MTRSRDDILAALKAGPLNQEAAAPRDVVKFETLWSDPADGWAIASRAAARAMHLAGVPVNLHEWKPLSDNLDDAVMGEVGHLLHPVLRGLRARELAGNVADWPSADQALHVFSTTLGDFSSMDRHAIGPLLRMKRPIALYTTFERLTIEPALGELLNRLDGMWVPCTSNLDTLKAAGVTNCTMIPFPFFPDDPHLRIPPVTGRRKFYWIGRWEPRKAPDRLVHAFLLAFKPGDATLTMKTSPIVWHGAWLTLDAVLAVALDDPAVIANGWNRQNWRAGIDVITGRLTVDEMVKLHADHDIYVSTSRGEGTDLPALQSKLANRRLVTTDSGGPRDFLGEGDIMVPMKGAVPADPMYMWGPGAAYADHSMNDIVTALQSACSDTRKTINWPREKFEAARVGMQFKVWTDRVKARQ